MQAVILFTMEQKNCVIKQNIPQQLREEIEELKRIGVECSEINFLIGLKTGRF
jgi:hypothetical protein